MLAIYVMALPKREVVLPHWQVASQCLLAAVEKGGGLVMMARIAMMHALQAGQPEPALQPRKKSAKNTE